MTKDFGPTGDEPPLASAADLTQPVPMYDATGPIAQQWLAQQAVLEPPPRTGARTIIIAFGAGTLVTVALGVYGGLHDPTGQALNISGFTDGLHAKAWLASLAMVLAFAQLLSALAMWGKLPGVRGDGKAVAWLHRWGGRAAVVVSLPVAAHCLYALGFDTASPRVLIHSLLGCLFYGMFVSKMIFLARDDKPGWALPVLGGLVFTGLTGLWLTSSLWFFTEFGVHF
jgi:uncharacterized protein DUF6529